MPPKTKKSTPAVSGVKHAQQPPEGEAKDESYSTTPSLRGKQAGLISMVHMAPDLIGIADVLNRLRNEYLHDLIHPRKLKHPRKPREKTLILPDGRTMIPD